MPTKTNFSESVNGKPVYADTNWTLIHSVTDTNYWHEIYLWVSNPNDFSVDCEIEFGKRDDFKTEARLVVPPKSGWNLFIPGFVLKKSTGISAVNQTVSMKSRDYGDFYVAGYVNKIDSQTYTSTTTGKYALSGSFQTVGDIPTGSIIELREANYFPPEDAKITLHTTPSGSCYDEIWLWGAMCQAWGGNNANYGYRECFLEWGDTGSVTSLLIPPDAGFVPLINGNILRNNTTIRAWAEDNADTEIFLCGFINRIEN